MMRAAATAALLLAGPALGSPLARLGIPSLSRRQTPSQTAPRGFSAFKIPEEDDVLVTGSNVSVSWTTNDSYVGTVVLELGEAGEEGEVSLKKFVHTEYDIPFLQGNYTWTVPEDLEPGPYALRLAQSTTPTTFVDSPIFSIVHAAPAPTESLDIELPPRRPTDGLTEGQKIGIGTGIALAAFLVLGGFLIWRYSRRQQRAKWDARQSVSRGTSGPGSNPGSVRAKGGLGGIAWGNMSPRTVVASSPVTDPGSVPLDEGDKLPEGVMSGWGPGSLEPVELPTEVYRRSGVYERRPAEDAESEGEAAEGSRRASVGTNTESSRTEPRGSLMMHAARPSPRREKAAGDSDDEAVSPVGRSSEESNAPRGRVSESSPRESESSARGEDTASPRSPGGGKGGQMMLRLGGNVAR